MKKAFKVEDLDCAHCAAKIEEAIKNIDGVESANLSFMAQRLVIKAPDDKMDEIVEEAKRISKKIEPDCNIVG